MATHHVQMVPTSGERIGSRGLRPSLLDEQSLARRPRSRGPLRPVTVIRGPERCPIRRDGALHILDGDGP